MVQQASPASRLHFVADDTPAALPEYFAARRPSVERVWAIQDDRPELRLVLFFVRLLVLAEGDRLAAQPGVSGLRRHLQSGVAQFLKSLRMAFYWEGSRKVILFFVLACYLRL
jgi:hypothetical protein